MSWQAAPPASQIRHWYWNPIGDEPPQVPGFAVTVLPTAVSPPIVGRELFEGATAVRVVTAAAVPAITRHARAAAASTRRCRRVENRTDPESHFIVDDLLRASGGDRS
jgi:hypothetical protein